MREQDFANIRYFDKKEVEETGSKIEDVEYETIRKLDDFREMIACPVYLIKNGLTTGEHKSGEHPEGKAVDFVLGEQKRAKEIFNCLLECGFRGIGIYWNTITNSYHADIGKYRSWKAVKVQGGIWHYTDLIINPQEWR